MIQAERDRVDASLALCDLRDQLLETMRDALTYRSCVIVCLDLLAERTRELELARRRLRDIWDADTDAEADQTERP